MRLTPPRVLLIFAILVVAVAFGVTQAMTANAPGAVKTDGSSISRIMGSATPNDSAEFEIQLLEGNDAAHESAHIFGSLQDVPGLAEAALDTETLVLAVSFDSAVANAAAIRTTLVRAGYVPLTEADATSAEMAEDSTVQRIAIADTGDGFAPALITAKAGVPLEITFGPGKACRISVSVPALNLALDIAEGGVMTLPALQAGTYDIECSGGATEASVIVK